MNSDILKIEVYNDSRNPTRKVSWVEGARSLALFVAVPGTDEEKPDWAEVSVASRDEWWGSRRPSAYRAVQYAQQVLIEDDRWTEFEMFGG